jgi:hypothetical protein
MAFIGEPPLSTPVSARPLSTPAGETPLDGTAAPFRGFSRGSRRSIARTEWEQLRAHPLYGEALVEPLREWLGDWIEAVGYHHERWDGKGYPRAVAGEQIPLAGRIVAIADVFDVITSARSYKEPASAAEAREEITRCSGTQFDPSLVRAFVNISLGRMRLDGPALVALARPAPGSTAAHAHGRRGLRRPRHARLPTSAGTTATAASSPGACSPARSSPGGTAARCRRLDATRAPAVAGFALAASPGPGACASTESASGSRAAARAATAAAGSRQPGAELHGGSKPERARGRRRPVDRWVGDRHLARACRRSGAARHLHGERG